MSVVPCEMPVARPSVPDEFEIAATHGLELLAPYLGQIEKGAMAKDGEPELIADHGAAVTWNGRYLPGPWLVCRAFDLAIERAYTHKVATVVIRQSSHIGCLAAYLKRANALRRRMGEDVSSETGAEVEAEEIENAVELSDERFAAMQVAEQIILTVSENGYGKRSLAYEYRVTGRGGKGIVAMAVNERNGKLVASFPVDVTDQIMLVTNGGQLIRCPVDGIRVAGRSTQGVTVFNTADEEHVVSVERIGDEGMDDAEWSDTVKRNKEHLEIMLAKDFWTSEDLKPLQDAVK